MLTFSINKVFSVVFTITLVFLMFGSFIRTVTPLVSKKRSPSTYENWLKKVDSSKKPCQDFYQFACGKHKDANTEIERAEEKIRTELLEILTEPQDREENHYARISKQMFEACLTYDDDNVQQLKEMIQNMGGWSLLDPTWNVEDFSVVKFYSDSYKNGYLPQSLFGIDIEINPENRRNIIVIKPKVDSRVIQKTGKFREFFHDTFLPKLAAVMEINKKKLEEEAVEFEKISKFMDVINDNALEPRRWKLSTLQTQYKDIPWLNILNAIFKPINNTEITYNDIVQIQCPRCLTLLNQFFQKNDKKSLSTYLMGSFVFDNIINADDELLVQWLNFKDLSREDFCADRIFTFFRRVWDYEYFIGEYLDESIIPKVEDLIQKQKSAMEEIIRSSDVVNSNTRDQAIDKVNSISFKIGFDDDIKQGRVLDYYQNLDLHPRLESYFSSLFKIRRFLTDKVLSSLRKPPKLPYLEATSGNADYLLHFNTVFLSLSVVTGALYSTKDRPEYLNFGGLGFIIAHEMNHAFDRLGRQFDKFGKTKKWWDEETEINQNHRMECMEKQYSEFVNEETGHKVNAHQTLNENFCDIGGTEVAYKAYSKVNKHKESSLLNFEKYTDEQLFWISFATSKCSKSSKEDVLYREKVDVHAEERIRVNGVAMNSKEFAKDWYCEKNAPMNPEHRCLAWK